MILDKSDVRKALYKLNHGDKIKEDEVQVVFDTLNDSKAERIRDQHNRAAYLTLNVLTALAYVLACIGATKLEGEALHDNIFVELSPLRHSYVFLLIILLRLLLEGAIRMGAVERGSSGNPTG